MQTLGRSDAIWRRRILGLAALLTAPILLLGFAQDDFMMRLAVAGRLEGFPLRAPWDLFRFVDPARQPYDLDHAWPWFASTDLKIAFFRPLSSLVHTLFFVVAPELPFVHHAYSWLLYLAAIAAVHRIATHLFANDGHGFIVLLATLMFAVDDGHGLSIGWIANQNGLASATLGLWAVALTLGPLLRGHQLSVVLYALALLSGEAGVAALPTLLLLGPSASMRARLLHALPYVGVTLVWMLALRFGGYHTVGSVFYTHPLFETLPFVAHFPQRVGLMLGAMLWNVWPDPWGATGFERPIGIASLCVASVALALIHKRVAHLAKARAVRAVLWGAVLSVVPFAASDPNDRNLVFSSAGILLGLAAAVFTRRADIEHVALGAWLRDCSKPQKLVLVLHVALAVILLPLRTQTIDVAFGTIGAAAYRTLEPSGNLIVVNAPDWLTTTTAVARQRAEQNTPRTVHVLLSSGKDCLAERVDARTLRLRCPERFFEGTVSRIPQRADALWPAGTSFSVGAMQVTLRSAMLDGHVQASDGAEAVTADFAFAHNLDTYRFQTWSVDGYIDWALPPIGQSQGIPAIHRPLSMLRAVERRVGLRPEPR